MRLISSQVAHPTSPIQSSLVPGRKVKRKGLRIPYPMIRRALGLLLLNKGFVDKALPVAGSRRRRAPLRTTGSPAGRRTLWLRSAPPSAVGGDSTPPTPAGGSPHGLS